MAQADSKWPRWPDGAKSKQLVRVRVAWDVDTLFKAMFGTASPFAVRHAGGQSGSNCNTAWLWCTFIIPPFSVYQCRILALGGVGIRAVCAIQIKSQEARGNKELRETPWLPLEAALTGVDMQPVAELRSDAGGGSSSAGGSGSSRGKGKAGSKAPVALVPQGSVRRIGFSAAGMGMKVA